MAEPSSMLDEDRFRYALVAVDLPAPGVVPATAETVRMRLLTAGARTVTLHTETIADPRKHVIVKASELGDDWTAEHHLAGRTVERHTYLLDERELRPATAHGIGYHAGYVVHIDRNPTPVVKTEAHGTEPTDG